MGDESPDLTAEAMQDVFAVLTLNENGITPTDAAQRIDAIVHSCIDEQLNEAAADPSRPQHAGNPDGIIWELWEQLCIRAKLSANGEILVEFLRALERLPKRRVLQITDWGDNPSNVPDERELWTDLADLGTRPLKEWLWEFDECMCHSLPYAPRHTQLISFPEAHFCRFEQLDSPPPGCEIRQQCRNYNAFTARVMTSRICFTTARDGRAALRNVMMALEEALEPDRRRHPRRLDILTPEARSGHIPAAAEWIRHASKLLWIAVQEGYFEKIKYDRKGIAKPEWSIPGRERWKTWKQEFYDLSEDDRYEEEVRTLCLEAFGLMNAADGSDDIDGVNGKE